MTLNITRYGGPDFDNAFPFLRIRRRILVMPKFRYEVVHAHAGIRKNESIAEDNTSNIVLITHTPAVHVFMMRKISITDQRLSQIILTHTFKLQMITNDHNLRAASSAVQSVTLINTLEPHTIMKKLDDTNEFQNVILIHI